MKKEIVKPIVFAPLSSIKNPAALVQNPGDSLSLRVTKTGRKVAKLCVGGIKRAMVEYPDGSTVETIAYR